MSKFYTSINEAIQTLISLADSEVGYLEKKTNKDLDSKAANAGSNNYTKYGRDMNLIYPSVMDFPAAWCDCFVDWCFYKTFEITNAKKILCGNFDDYTIASAQLYKNKKAWYISKPQVGDQIFFKNATRIYHTGLVYKVDLNYVYTIEGNTSNGTAVIANGGSVCKKKYFLSNSNIAGYGRPLYQLAVKASALETFDISVGVLGLTIAVDFTLNVRDYPKSGALIGVIKNSERIYPSKKCFIAGEPWYYIPDKKGWISAKYIDGGWVKECSISSPYKWWYIHKGYTCITNDIEIIGGKKYYFGESGYMLENTEITFRINMDGEMSKK